MIYGGYEFDCGLCGFGGFVMGVVDYGGFGCGGGSGLWLMVAVGCFTRWQWVVVGLFRLVVVGGGSGLQWWLVVAVDCGGCRGGKEDERGVRGNEFVEFLFIYLFN